MATYLETTRAHSEHLKVVKLCANGEANESSLAQWQERLTPLEDRLSRLLSTMPEEITAQGLVLDDIRRLLSGKWRGNCHPGELGAAFRKLGYQRRRNWSDATQSFNALWFHQGIESKTAFPFIRT
jgi:hypothetical protein